jgi:predicted nucleic acid-binding protein
MVIVDTSVWIDVFAQRETAQVMLLRSLSAGHTIATGDLMLCEVLQGTRSQAEHDRVLRTLHVLPVFEMVSVPTAVAAAGNYRRLRSRGLTVRSTVDCPIATFCLQERCVLLHNDRDFGAFEAHLGLRVIR